MLKTSMIVAAVCVLGLASPGLVASSTAAAFHPTPPPTTGGQEGGGPGGGGNGGDLPTVAPEDQLRKIAETCNAALGNLVKIPVSMVVGFASEGGVSVVPVCNSGLGKKAAIDNSQALPLQPAIGANPALSGPLKQGGFSADNVVGVVLLNGVATLYVHKGM